MVNREKPANFLIKVQGSMSPRVTDNIGFSVSVNETDGRIVTILSGEDADQAALMGILNYLYDLGFFLLDVEYQSSLKKL